MSYEVGTFIDLQHLNVSEKAAEEYSGWQDRKFPIGTHFDFTKDLKTVLHIPVAFAQTSW